MSETASAPVALEELSRRNFLHPFTSINDHQQHGPTVMTRGDGIYVWDNQGKQYLDALAGLWCVNVGYGREEIAQAVAQQVRDLTFYQAFLGMATEPAIRLASEVADLTPGDCNRIFFGNSGSDANDTAIKLIWYYNNLLGRPRKKKLLARRGAYHGVTVASGSLTGLPPVHQHFDLPVNDRFIHLDRPHYYWEAGEGMSELDFTQHLARNLEETIAREGADTIAAFFGEPMLGAGGVVPPPEGYWETIVPILREHDILIVADEVICGFGRLGSWFGCEHFGYQPDIMSLAKGLTSGYVPMSANAISDKMWAVLQEGSAEVGPFAHGYTYSAHPVAAAAGLANLAIMKREDLVGNAARRGPYLQERLRAVAADHPLVGQVRGLGFVAGVEVVEDKAHKKPFDPKRKMGGRLAAAMRAEGLIVRSIVNTCVISPPLTLTDSDIDEICVRFERGLHRLTQELAQAGEWHAG
mgnify:CR=1 FL=1